MLKGGGSALDTPQFPVISAAGENPLECIIVVFVQKWLTKVAFFYKIFTTNQNLNAPPFFLVLMYLFCLLLCRKIK
jgi:hypothetical protein